MSTGRLAFLYPHLFRRAGAAPPATRATWPSRANLAKTRRPGSACFAVSTPPKQAGFKRHGKAVEPTPLGGPPAAPEVNSGPAPEQVHAAPPAPEPSAPETTADSADLSPDAKAADTASAPAVAGTGASPTTEEGGAPQEKPKQREGGPMEAILQREPLENMKKPPPHLTAPPYVHHFDSHSLVKQLEAGGYTQDQAITAMKAVRSLLAVNLDVAQDGLVSKSAVENETYLFTAACSELSAEVAKSERLQDEAMRQQRTMLQHEVDILTQSLNQEVLTLNDVVRGMFNDRKMAVREEQKWADSAIQQLSYKITIMLNSEAKSDIERLRGVLIRRAILGIIFMAVFTLGTLQYASYRSHMRHKQAEKLKQDMEAAREGGGRVDHSSAADAAQILSAS